MNVNTNAHTYEPTKAGQGVLRIEAKPGVFGDENTGRAKEVELKEMEVFISPFEASAGVDEDVAFTVRVTNAIDTRVKWRKEGPGTLTPTESSATLRTPMTEWDPAIKVYARSLAATGLREGKVDSDPREDMAPVSLSDPIVIIDPFGKCLEPNENLTFGVSLTPGTVETVTWTIDPPNTGSFSGNTYTAPPSMVGDVNLTATVNDEYEATTQVRIAACVCEWFGTVVGDVFGAHLGSVAYLPMGSASIALPRSTDSDDFVSFQLTADRAINGIGQYDALVTYSRDLGDLWGTAVDNQAPLAQLTIFRYDPVANQIEGSFTGELQKIKPGTFDPIEYFRATMTVTFEGQIWDGASDLCE